jgi:predicted transposase/invertase (TIGR01784 family)
MADFKSAKVLLSALLGQDIEVLELLPQERALSLEDQGVVKLSVVRFDYCATLNIEGEKKKVLIELQKGKKDIDIARFRRYLGIHYNTKDHSYGEEEVLPIIAIYLFGFEMKGIEPAITRFHPAGTDLIENVPLVEGKNEIVDCLTHTSYFVQLNKLPSKSQHRVARILSVFSQHWVQQDGKRLLLPDEIVNDEEIKVLVDRLHNALLDNETQRQLVEEYEYDRTIERNIKEFESIARAEGRLEGRMEGLRETAKNLKAIGLPIMQIVLATGLTEAEIESI